jgi:hypothetical protein
MAKKPKPGGDFPNFTKKCPTEYLKAKLTVLNDGLTIRKPMPTVNVLVNYMGNERRTVLNARLTLPNDGLTAPVPMLTALVRAHYMDNGQPTVFVGKRTVEQGWD